MTWLAPHPVLTRLGGFPLTAHGVFFAVAAVVGVAAAHLLARRRGLSREWLWEISAAVFGIGLLSARVGYFLTYPDEFASLGQVAAIWEGGLVSFWGIAGGLAAAAVLFRRTDPKHWREWLDLLSLAALYAWSVGRLGNYYAADSVGVASSGWEAFYGRVPIQLFESGWTLLLALVLTSFYLTRTPPPGRVLFLALGGYLAGRLVIDAWREESVLGGLRVSQWVSLFGVALLALSYGRYGWRTAHRE